MASLQELYAFCAICSRLWRVRPPMFGCRNVTFNLLEGDVTTIARMRMNAAYVAPLPVLPSAPFECDLPRSAVRCKRAHELRKQVSAC